MAEKLDNIKNILENINGATVKLMKAADILFTLKKQIKEEKNPNKKKGLKYEKEKYEEEYYKNKRIIEVEQRCIEINCDIA